METQKTEGRSKRWIALPVVAVLLVGIGAAFVFWWSRVEVLPPEPPDSPAPPVAFPATTSYLPVAGSLPTASIATLLEGAIPRTFAFDVRGDVHAYGSPSRGAITVHTDVPGKRVTASTPVSGRVQVEKKIVFANASVGIDVSGTITASFAPEAKKDWSVDPRLALSAQVNRAIARTPLIDFDVTGHAQNAVNKAVNDNKGKIETELAKKLKFRNDAERVWKTINSVHQLSKDPPTWLRITPRKVTFRSFDYKPDSVETGLALTLETSVFVQDERPKTLDAPLPALDIASALADEFNISIPVQVSYDTLNAQLAAQFAKGPLELPDEARVEITGATLRPYGAGVLLRLEFKGKKGCLKSASGRLYVVGIPVFDPATATLRVDQLDYTADTRNLLVKSVDWLAHDRLLELMKDAAVVNLNGEIDKAKSKANEEIAELKKQLPKEIGADVSVTSVAIERLAFANDRAFMVVKAKGKMSARLR